MTMLQHFAAAMRITEAACGLKPVIRARYEGHQFGEGCDGLDLWTLLEPLPGHPVSSTVSSDTIKRAGFSLPNVKVR